MAEGDTNPMGDDALAEMQIDEVRAPPGPDNCGPFWHWEISEEQLVECVKDKIPLVLRSYVDPKKKGKIQLHTILDPQDQVYCLDCVAHAIGLPEDQIPLNPQSLKLHKAGTSLYQHCMGKTGKTKGVKESKCLKCFGGVAQNVRDRRAAAAQQEAEEQRKILAEKERAAEEAARLAESARPFQPVEAETMTVESLCKQFHWDLNDPAKVQQATAMIDAIQGSDKKQAAKEPQPQSDDDQSDSEQSDNPGETMTAKQKSKKNASSPDDDDDEETSDDDSPIKKKASKKNTPSSDDDDDGDGDGDDSPSGSDDEEEDAEKLDQEKLPPKGSGRPKRTRQTAAKDVESTKKDGSKSPQP